MTAIREPILTAGFPLGSSLGLVMAFEWLGQPYRLTRVDMLAEMRSDAYLRLNGRQETPVLITDNGPLTETMAIALWLEARDNERRISFTPGTRPADQLHQYIAFLNTGFTGAFAPLWVALEAEDASDDYRNALRQLGCTAVAKRHKQLEAMIGDSDYLMGTSRRWQMRCSPVSRAGWTFIRRSISRTIPEAIRVSARSERGWRQILRSVLRSRSRTAGRRPAAAR
jgi:glutathione S-transferase